ncbi:ABC transporter ATP-binding protein [Clostridium sp. D2Q-11]|uniref:ABC transporter ATP-binding protein n=1 Tax=Anaeromonas frigoriresistens TaxID=2683708 RepID=A0A942UU04_9FIRM|nr:ABC transporter ATP-binding protein [Anaeromonas frigoriresistens]MBS4539118.1 ABC transporter ATP-binding protein [Anaeromonas frigoriresistens]
MSKIVEMKGLSKSYMNKIALKDVNLNIEKGKILGLLGPNGSGKTTMIKILMGILTQSSGEVYIDGKKPGTGTKAIVSYLPDRNFLYKWMKVKDAINFFNDFYEDFDMMRAKELLKFMELEENIKVSKLSKGMIEKLHLTLVLSRRAKLYILDEPIAGVDPVAREKILDAIINNYNEDSSMIITTHLVKDLERVFNEVAFLKYGEIVLTGDVEELRVERAMSVDEIYREVFK